MISSGEASQQIERLSGLDYWPRGEDNKPGRKELRLAAEVAESCEVLKAVVDDWVASQTQCPKPAELRRLIYDKNSQRKEQLSRCRGCGGNGAITVWRLVTYKGNSFVVEKSERIDVHSQEEANEFLANLARVATTVKQTVLTAAETCYCRKSRADVA
jgi:hypothetical protein